MQYRVALLLQLHLFAEATEHDTPTLKLRSIKMESNERHMVWHMPNSKKKGIIGFMKKKWVKRTFYSLVAMFLVLITTGFILVYAYEDELKAMALEEVQANLTSPMDVGEVDVTFWAGFPNISLQLQDVVIHETFEEADTLIFASDLYFEFDLFDLLGGEYVVKKVTLDEGFVGLKRDETGADNFHFWKSSENTNDTLQFALEEVELANCRFEYTDLKSQVFVKTMAENVKLGGEFGADVLELDMRSDLLVEQIGVESYDYVSHAEVSTDLKLIIDTDSKVYQFRDGTVDVEGISFGIESSFAEMEEGVLMDLAVKSEGSDIERLASLLPAHVATHIQSYTMAGDISIDGTVSGLAGGGHIPEVVTDFVIDDGDFIHSQSNVAIRNIDATGMYRREKNNGGDALSISSCKANLESGSFSVSGSIVGFSQSQWDLNLAGNFNLEDIKKFAELEALGELDGLVAANISYKGNFANLGNVRVSDLESAKVSGVVELERAMFRLNGAPHRFENIGGKLDLQNSDIAIRNFTGEVKGSDFNLNGHFRNMLPYMFVDGEILTLEANLQSTLLDFNPLLQEGGGSQAYHLEFPNDLHFELDLGIQHLKFREFDATGLNGHAELRNQVLYLDPLSFNTSEGSFTASGTADGRTPEGFALQCEASMKGINVNELFHEFENFGQSFIKQEHLRGTAYADITFSAWMGSDLSFDSNRLHSYIDIALEDGQLIELRSMQHIASYIRSNRLIAPFVNEDVLEEKLHHIYFSRLENQIEIRNGVIHVPNMMIESSAMDISAQGTHAFTNDIDYTIGFQVRDILCKSSDTEFGTVEDDGLSNSFFLSMAGTTELPEFGYDRLAHKEKRQADREKEKEVFKNIIKEELNIFGGGNKGSEGTGHDSQITIEIEDPEEDPKPRKKKRLRDLLKDKEEEEKVTISIDDDE